MVLDDGAFYDSVRGGEENGILHKIHRDGTYKVFWYVSQLLVEEVVIGSVGLETDDQILEGLVVVQNDSVIID